MPLMKHFFILPLVILFAALIATNAQYNQTSVIPSKEAGGIPTTVVNNLAGISAIVMQEKDTDKILIVQVLPEGAAEKAGLLAKDYIVKIDDKQIGGMDIQSVVAMLRGDPGTKVKITVAREEFLGPNDFTVTRELVRLKEVSPK